MNDNFFVSPDVLRLTPEINVKDFKRDLRRGKTPAITVWNNEVIFNVREYQYCIETGIDFNTKQLYFETREKVLLWLSETLLFHTEALNDTMRSYLYGCAVKLKSDLFSDSCEMSFSEKMVYISAEYGKTTSSLYRRKRIYDAIERMNAVAPECVPYILSESVKISHENMIKLGRLSRDKIVSLFSEVYGIRLEPKTENTDCIKQTEVSRKIKDMPEYDPDAEISSLKFTVPSWTSSVERVINTTDFKKVSDKAQEELLASISNHMDVINKLTDILLGGEM